jgi:hypothetical protein
MYCTQCGRRLSPVAAVLSCVCGDCVRKNHHQVTGQNKQRVRKRRCSRIPSNGHCAKPPAPSVSLRHIMTRRNERSEADATKDRRHQFRDQ